MIRRLRNFTRRFLRREDGSPTVEFVIVFPVIAVMIVMTLELGVITLRQVMLERGLDMAVREVRLGTGSQPEHDDIKDLICRNALVINNCDQNLYVEMVPTDPRAFNAVHPVASCTDEEVESRPVRSVTPGQENELVLLRACVLYDPVFPDGLLPRYLTKDGQGRSAVIDMTAFVQEPI
jgi:Flp pilus assembly protein TadG